MKLLYCLIIFFIFNSSSNAKYINPSNLFQEVEKAISKKRFRGKSYVAGSLNIRLSRDPVTYIETLIQGLSSNYNKVKVVEFSLSGQQGKTENYTCEMSIDLKSENIQGNQLVSYYSVVIYKCDENNSYISGPQYLHMWSEVSDTSSSSLPSHVYESRRSTNVNNTEDELNSSGEENQAQ